MHATLQHFARVRVRTACKGHCMRPGKRMTHMKLSQFALLLVSSGAVALAGCSHTTYVQAAPPPPPANWQGPSPLVSLAEHNGFRDGREDGARDALNGRPYRPEHDARFHNTPGYDPGMGPFPAYRDYYRNAYTRGYYQGFTRHE